MPHDDRSLKLAFTLHMAERILGADLDVVSEESSWLHATFPVSSLYDNDFIDPFGERTPTFEAARDQALQELPGRLSAGEKLEVMGLLIDAAAADGVLAAEEATELARAAKLLGVRDSVWSDHLQSLIANGSLRRDDAGA